MQLSKWGDSLAIRLPVAVVERLNLKEGDDVEVTVLDNVQLGLAKKTGRQEFLELIERFQGTVPLDFKFDRDEANER